MREPRKLPVSGCAGIRKPPHADKVPGKLFLVVADTTNLITDLRVEEELRIAAGK
jgi:hypothetical protein